MIVGSHGNYHHIFNFPKHSPFLPGRLCRQGFSSFLFYLTSAMVQ
jgi:hypothetical protein